MLYRFNTDCIILAFGFFFELRRPKQPVFDNAIPFVSVIVPAYNEAKVLARCIESILWSDYPTFELILVDDGSTDPSYAVMNRYTHHPHVLAVTKPNAGKASALNKGLELARGEIIFLVDADGIFQPFTIWNMLNGFTRSNVGGVCGNDSPINLNCMQTRLAKLQTHVSTGIVRRALSMINCLPIISGNIGAFRRTALQKTGPLREGFIGEDLELTWRLHRAGYRVNFAPAAVVSCEIPSTIRGLWKQRVRWSRGFLQTAWIHWRMFFNFKYGLIALFLPLNFISVVCIPILQLIALILFPFFLFAGNPHWIEPKLLIGWLGLGSAFGASLFGIIIERAWRDLKYLYLVPLWVLYSLFMDCVMVWAIFLEILKAKSEWNKLERTGVVTHG